MNWISHIFELKQNHSLPFSSETIIAMVRNTMHIFFVLCDSLVIRQKGKYQNGGNKKTKHAKFSEKTNVSYPLIHTRTCVYQGVRNVQVFLVFFFGKFDVLCFLVTSVLRFALLPYYQRIDIPLLLNREVTCRNNSQ